MVAYLTEGMEITLNIEFIKRPAVAKWFNPSTGEWSDADVANQSIQKFCPADNNDWVLWIETDK
jgi:hypothetical protein